MLFISYHLYLIHFWAGHAPTWTPRCHSSSQRWLGPLALGAVAIRRRQTIFSLSNQISCFICLSWLRRCSGVCLCQGWLIDFLVFRLAKRSFTLILLFILLYLSWITSPRGCNLNIGHLEWTGTTPLSEVKGMSSTSDTLAPISYSGSRGYLSASILQA